MNGKDFSGLEEILLEYKPDLEIGYVIPSPNHIPPLCELEVRHRNGKLIRFDMLSLYGVPDIQSEDVRRNPLPIREKLDSFFKP